MKNKFILCGVIGWCLEIFWTGLDSYRHRKLKLEGHSSIWMFPIYGCAAFLSPLSKRLASCNMWIRGTIYTVGIFFVEFVSGSWLKKRGICPWDYSKYPSNINGVIRLDYAPLWFLVGLLYEKILVGVSKHPNQ